jgi:hypothetical protein
MRSGPVRPRGSPIFSFSTSVRAIDGILKSFERQLQMLDPRPTRRQPVGIFRTSQPSGGVSAREEEGARPNGRMRLLPQVSIVASSSAPRRDVRFGGLRLGMKSRPRGQLATTYATPLAGRERPERPPALPTAPLRRQRGLRPGRLRQRRGALRCGVASMRSTDCWAMANTTRWPAWQALNDRAIERWVLPVPRAEEADFAVLGDPCELCELQGQRLLGAGLGGEVEVRQGLVGWECRGGCAGGAGREPRAAHPRGRRLLAHHRGQARADRPPVRHPQGSPASATCPAYAFTTRPRARSGSTRWSAATRWLQTTIVFAHLNI